MGIRQVNGVWLDDNNRLVSAVMVNSDGTDALAALRPASSLAAVTPSDGADLAGGVCRALYVGTEGDISVIAEDDTAAVTLKGISGWVQVRAKRVRATGTTATDIVALY